MLTRGDQVSESVSQTRWRSLLTGAYWPHGRKVPVMVTTTGILPRS